MYADSRSVHRPVRRSGAALALLLALLLVVAPPAGARAVDDPDIGWPSALRKELRLPKVDTKRCDKEHTRATIRRQNRIMRRGDPRDELYRILHRKSERNMWGSMWVAVCAGGSERVGVAYAGSPRDARRAVRRARAVLARRKLSRDVRLVAVRSTYRQLEQENGRLSKRIGKLAGREWIASGIDTSRNTLDVDVLHRVPEATRMVLRAFARRSPVAVVLNVEPAPDPNAPIPTYSGAIVLDPASIDRAAATVRVAVHDQSCAADESYDSAARFTGVEVRRDGAAYALSARFRINRDWPLMSTCEGDHDPRSRVETTVTLPEPLGDLGLAVPGDPDEGDRALVLLPPVGDEAIRSLVPRYVYAGDLCDAPDVRRAFAGRKKTTWCFF